MKHALIAALVALAGACAASQRDMVLPSPVSAPAVPRGGGLRAGFGRADITPPPGVGLSGHSVEGQQARGYRHHLYARALALESATGERVALVVADLGHVSAVLQRLTAERVARSGAGIGADRLVLAATHTHSGPGNFFDAAAYNDNAGVFPGYDPYLVEFLVARLSTAVAAAIDDLKPAKAAWGSAAVPGVTRNRSLDALLLDPEAGSILGSGAFEPGARHDSALMRHATDDTLLMLRVDRCGRDWSPPCQPRGAFSVFAMHGTAYPSANDLLDGDVHAIVERQLEHHIDAQHPGSAPQAYHLLANGAEGDVSPEWSTASRCDRSLKFQIGHRPGGPRTPPPPEEWRIGAARLQRCLDEARKDAARLGKQLGDAAVALFDTIGPTLSSDVLIARAFETLDLHHLETSHPLCADPLDGTASFAGTDDGRSRLAGWRFLWLFRSGIEQGGSAIDRDHGTCHGAKRIGLGGLQRVIMGRRGLPQYAQLALVRIGRTVIAAIPGEPTTVAGIRMKGAVRAMAPESTRIALVGLANGYLQYITTAEEYEAQRYEGGSTIYGPNTAAALSEALARLAWSLRGQEPRVHVGSIVASVGANESFFPRPTADPPPSSLTRRFLAGPTCQGGVLRAEWLDHSPGAVVPADGPLLRFERGETKDSTSWQPVGWDDGAEVRAAGPYGAEGYRWTVRWVAEPPSSGRYRVVLAERAGGITLLPSDPIVCANEHKRD